MICTCLILKWFINICSGEKFGKGTTNFGTSKLVRGYKDPASREDRLPPIGHVVFVIHGIGQNMDISCITKSTNE